MPDRFHLSLSNVLNILKRNLLLSTAIAFGLFNSFRDNRAKEEKAGRLGGQKSNWRSFDASSVDASDAGAPTGQKDVLGKVKHSCGEIEERFDALLLYRLGNDLVTPIKFLFFSGGGGFKKSPSG